MFWFMIQHSTTILFSFIGMCNATDVRCVKYDMIWYDDEEEDDKGRAGCGREFMATLRYYPAFHLERQEEE